MLGRINVRTSSLCLIDVMYFGRHLSRLTTRSGHAAGKVRDAKSPPPHPFTSGPPSYVTALPLLSVVDRRFHGEIGVVLCSPMARLFRFASSFHLSSPNEPAEEGSEMGAAKETRMQGEEARPKGGGNGGENPSACMSEMIPEWRARQQDILSLVEGGAEEYRMH